MLATGVTFAVCTNHSRLLPLRVIGEQCEFHRKMGRRYRAGSPLKERGLSQGHRFSHFPSSISFGIPGMASPPRPGDFNIAMVDVEHLG
jgi:hypothetical protein